nr:YchJ family metal-binding protein [uncultured Roseateles sp.]
MKSASQACPCGSSRPYEACCGRLHSLWTDSGQGAPDAEALMRSRYSAYVLELQDYLLATWHASTRPAALEANEHGLKWLGLDVKQHQVQDADHATVEFVARSKLAGRAHRMHEISRFVRENGFWFYVDAQT